MPEQPKCDTVTVTRAILEVGRADVEAKLLSDEAVEAAHGALCDFVSDEGELACGSDTHASGLDECGAARASLRAALEAVSPPSSSPKP